MNISILIAIFVSTYIQIYATIYPNGGEIFRSGEQIELRWEAEIFADETVRVLIHDGRRGQSIVVTENHPGKIGKVTWRIPAGFSGDLYRLVVISARQYYRDIRGLTNGVYGIMVRFLNGEQVFGKFIVQKE